MDISDYIDRPSSAASSLNSQEIIDMTDPEDLLLSPEEFAQKWDNDIHRLNEPTPREAFMTSRVRLPRQYPQPGTPAERGVLNFTLESRFFVITVLITFQELHNSIMRDLRIRIEMWKDEETFEQRIDRTALLSSGIATPQATLDDIDTIMRSLMPVTPTPATPTTPAPSGSNLAAPTQKGASENTKPETKTTSKKKPKSSSRA